MGVPVVMGGIHATFCRGGLEHTEAVVTGEAESVWGRCWWTRATMRCAGV